MPTLVRAASVPETLPLPQKIARMDTTRMRAYQDNLAFYEGRQWDSPQRRRERRLVLNYARTVVEKTASYTMSGVSFAVDPDDGSSEAAERARRIEATLRDVYDANALDQLDFDNEVDCSVLGDAAYKVTWDADERRVRVSAPDVQGLYAWWKADDPARLLRVACRYSLSQDEAESLFGPLPRARRAERIAVEAWTGETFELWLDGALIESAANPYGFIPFVIYPNVREPKRFWGSSDLDSLKEPLRELNRAMSQLSMILELSGNPIAVLENVTEAQDIAVLPGAVWEVPEKARAYLLDLLQGGGVGLHVDYLNVVLRTLHDLAEVPRSAFGETRQALSGVALELELDPPLKKVQRKRLIRGAAFRRRNEMILRILEQYAAEQFAPYRTRVVWGPVLPEDRSRLADDEAKLVDAGIHSRRTAAGLLGAIDPDTEWERWREEQTSVTRRGDSESRPGGGGGA